MKKMKKLWCGLLFLAGSCAFSFAHPSSSDLSDAVWRKFEMQNASKADPELITRDRVLSREDFSLPQIPAEWALMHGMKTGSELTFGMVKAQGDNIGTDGLTEKAVIENKAWGKLFSLEDGNAVFFTQENELSFLYGEFKQPYYKGVKISILDENLKVEKSFSLKTADTTMSISVLGTVSTRFFNNDAKREFVIQAHSFTRLSQGPAYARDTLYVVNEDGEILQRYGTASSALLKAVGSKKHFIVFNPAYSGLTDSIEVNVYDAAKPGTVLFHYARHRSQVSYTYSSAFSYYEAEGKPYYMAVFYEKPYVVSGSDPRDPEINKDNKLVIQLYEADKCTLEKEIRLDIFGQENHEWSMGSVRHFSDIMVTRNYFNQDSAWEIIYTVDRLIDECDCLSSDIYLVGEDGQIIEEIHKGSGGVIKLQDLPGLPSEYVVYEGTEDAITGFVMMEMPSMSATRFNTIQDGEFLSLTFERMPDPDYGKKYLFSLRSGEYYDDTASLCFAYFSPEGKMLKKFHAKIGEQTLSFQVVLNSETLNPYLFNGDGDLEVVILGMEENEARPDTYLHYVAIASEKTGSVLHKFYSHEQYGAMSGAGLIPNANNDRIVSFYVVYSLSSDMWNNSESTVFYDLPFAALEMKGKGTQSDPYIVTTPVELDYVRNEPAAWYELGNDIDMGNWLGINGKGFSPIGGETGFSGNFDGKGYRIKNLSICSGKNYTGLFGILNGSVIKNTGIENASVCGTHSNGAVGSLAGAMSNKAVLENCHVSAEVRVPSMAQAVGGLVGSASGEGTSIRQSSFSGIVEAPQASAAGGLVGTLLNAAGVDASYTDGTVLGSESGGLVGKVNQKGRIRNSYSRMQVSGIRNAGGLVGSLTGYLERSYASGNVAGERTAGGIAGFATSGINPGKLSYSAALNTHVHYTTPTNGKSYRIASWNDGIEVADTNYALATMKVGAADEEVGIASDDPDAVLNGKHGMSGSLAEWDEAFYKEMLKWNFGQTVESPWTMNGDRPHLWFEYVVRGIALDRSERTVAIGQEIKLHASVLPETAENRDVLWESSDATVASVDQTGTVKGKKKGEVVITAISDEGDYTASCKVTVWQPVEKLTLNRDAIVLAVGQIEMLEATVEPEDADNKDLLWRTTDMDVVMVSNGMIKGMGLGDAQIIVLSADGAASDTCRISVVVPVERIILDRNELSLDPGQTEQLTATVRPTEATNKALVWSSSDENVATVTETGLVTAIAKGTAVITVCSEENPSIRAICETTVGSVGTEKTGTADWNIRVRNGMLYAESDCEIRTLSVTDIQGRILIRREVRNKTAEIPVSHLVKGIYIVRAEFLSGDKAECKIYR